MSTYEIISLAIGVLGLILGGVANLRISIYKSSNKVGGLFQGGSNNQQAGRDIK